MNLDDVDGRFGEAWAGASPNGSHINLAIGRRGSGTAAAAAAAMARRTPGPRTAARVADAVPPDHRERALEILASRETARNRFYRGD